MTMLCYTYPRDCGQYTLHRKGDREKPVHRVEYKCFHWEHFRSGGQLNMRDISSSDSGSDSDDDEDETYVCEIELALYDKAQWHVYYADMCCEQADTRLLGRFATFEGAEIYARILFSRHSGGEGLFHGEKRVAVDVKYAEDAEDAYDRDFNIPSDHSDESCGHYIILVTGSACHAHSLNPYDDWDQMGQTRLIVQPPVRIKKTKVSRVDPGATKKTKRDKSG